MFSRGCKGALGDATYCPRAGIRSLVSVQHVWAPCFLFAAEVLLAATLFRCLVVKPSLNSNPHNSP